MRENVGMLIVYNASISINEEIESINHDGACSFHVTLPYGTGQSPATGPDHPSLDDGVLDVEQFRRSVA